MHKGQEKRTYRALVGKPEGNRSHGIPKRKWEDIKMDLQLIGGDSRLKLPGSEWAHAV